LDIIISDFQSKGRGGDSGKRILINEPGLYALMGKSRKPEARAFKRWVNHEVLPEIRKTGSYNAKTAFDPSTLTRLDILQMAIDSEKRALAAEESVKQLTTENRQLKPKGEYYDAFAELGNSTTFSRLAKHIGWGVIRFTKQLRQDKLIFHQGGINMPYQPYVDKGYFEIAMRNDGHCNYREQTRVTAKGVLYLASRYGKASQKIKAKQRLKQLENLERAKGQPGLRLITSAATAKNAAEKSAQPGASVKRSA
jgi:phage antirepressor YoqD-like protein